MCVGSLAVGQPVFIVYVYVCVGVYVRSCVFDCGVCLGVVHVCMCCVHVCVCACCVVLWFACACMCMCIAYVRAYVRACDSFVYVLSLAHVCTHTRNHVRGCSWYCVYTCKNCVCMCTFPWLIRGVYVYVRLVLWLAPCVCVQNPRVRSVCVCVCVYVCSTRQVIVLFISLSLSYAYAHTQSFTLGARPRYSSLHTQTQSFIYTIYSSI